MISVIVVEDHDGLREDVVFGLNAEGLQAQGAADAVEFDRLFGSVAPDVVVIDRMLPGEDGMSIARRVRQTATAKKTGIVFLSSLGSLDERIDGLGLADAYLVKPADLRELAAVISSVYRRLNLVPEGSEPGLWRIFPQRLELVSAQGQSTELSHKELQILALLANAQGVPVSARRLIEAIDEDWLQYEKNRLELILSRLRQKIRAAENVSTNPIKSVRNEGYLLTLTMLVVRP